MKFKWATEPAELEDNIKKAVLGLAKTAYEANAGLVTATYLDADDNVIGVDSVIMNPRRRKRFSHIGLRFTDGATETFGSRGKL